MTTTERINRAIANREQQQAGLTAHLATLAQELADLKTLRAALLTPRVDSALVDKISELLAKE